tara:strand:- start:4370 stop:4741 length:372 start_codon:yes stop_codon:yes gene_type:complete
MEVKKQRYYIYENINQLKNHNQIIELITMKDCKFTENDNGIFLNLNTVDDEIIGIIYQIIKNTLNYNEEIINYEDVLDNEEESSEIKHKPVEDQSIIKKESISFNLFSKDEKEIINESKKYNL